MGANDQHDDDGDDGLGDGWDIIVHVPERAGSSISDKMFDLVADTVHDAEEKRWPGRDGWDFTVHRQPAAQSNN